jgi:hypothetical protein
MYQIDVFFSRPDRDDPIHFERQWNAIPNVGDTVAVETEDATTGETDMHTGIVERRAFLSERNGDALRVQLTVVPENVIELDDDTL